MTSTARKPNLSEPWPYVREHGGRTYTCDADLPAVFCPGCSAAYSWARGQVQGDDTRRFNCKSCDLQFYVKGDTFTVENDGMGFCKDQQDIKKVEQIKADRAAQQTEQTKAAEKSAGLAELAEIKETLAAALGPAATLTPVQYSDADNPMLKAARRAAGIPEPVTADNSLVADALRRAASSKQ